MSDPSRPEAVPFISAAATAVDGQIEPIGRVRRTLLSYVILAVDAATSIVWGVSLVAVLTQVFSVTQAASVIFGLAIVNFSLMLDLGMTGFTYAIFRQKFVKGEAVDDLGVIKFIVGFFAAASVIITIAAGIASVTIYSSEGGAIFFGLALYSSLVPVWSVLSAIGRAIDRYIKFQFLELARKLVALFAFLMWSKAMLPSLGFVAAIGVSWGLCFLICQKELALIARLEIHQQSLRGIVGRALAASRFSLADFVFLQVPYLAVYAHFGTGGQLIIFDLFNKFRRASAIVLSVIVNGAAPSVTREYFHGRGRGVAVLWATLLAAGWLVSVALAVTLFGSQFVALVSAKKIDVSATGSFVLALGLILFGIDAYIGMSLVQIGKFNALWRIASLKLLALVGIMLASVVIRFSGEAIFVAYCVTTLFAPLVLAIQRSNLQ